MKFKPLIGAQMSGSIGGVTASHNRFGTYFRVRAVPTNPNTAFQAAVRATFGFLASAWKEVTVVRREGWETYAQGTPVTGPTGDPITLTGQQMYIRNNAARIAQGLAKVDKPPVAFGNTVLSTVSVAITAITNAMSVAFLNTDEWAIADDGALGIFVSRPVAPTINFFNGPYRFAQAILGNTALPPVSPDATGVAPFGYEVGQSFFARVIAVTAANRISQDVTLGPIAVVA